MNKNSIVWFLLFSVFFLGCDPAKEESLNPNIILVMADDLGYGDLAIYGNENVKTPNLDDMASAGVKFNRFYSAAPVCSPTRGSCLTGRHPYRYNIKWAGRYALPEQEITIAEYLKTLNYATGHFGKWHVGGLSERVNQSEFQGGPTPYSPPWLNGFDECFSTESMMPTYNPYYHIGGRFGTEEYRYVQDVSVEYGQETNGFEWKDCYWTGEDQMVTAKLAGDDSRIIVDRSLEFIQRQVEDDKQFFAVIWFHTPHTPVVAGKEHRALYEDYSMEQQHWYGSISAMDEQVGRLRNRLKEMGVAQNTLLWFCSDNGPSYIHDYNSAGGLRGKKAELYEGGIRVPAILEWPDRFSEGQVSDFPCYTSDFLPTVLDVCGIEPDENIPLDGVDILPHLLTENTQRPLFFQSPLPNRLKKSTTVEEEQFAVIEGDLKLISTDDGKSFQLFDLSIDSEETTDIANRNAGKVEEMKKSLDQWKSSCDQSARGKDYDD